MEYLVAAAAVLVIVVAYVAWLAGRIKRLQARVAAAHLVLVDQLARRRSAAEALVVGRPGAAAEAVRAAAHASRHASPDQLDAVENDLTRALRGLELCPDDPAVTELIAAGRRLGVARQVLNDAVRDTRALRLRRLPRALRLGGRHAMPVYFDIAEFTLTRTRAGEAEAAVGEATPGIG